MFDFQILSIFFGKIKSTKSEKCEIGKNSTIKWNYLQFLIFYVKLISILSTLIGKAIANKNDLPKQVVFVL